MLVAWCISSMSRVHVAEDRMQPMILPDSFLQPLVHPRADTGKEDWGNIYSLRHAKGWPCNGSGLRWVGKGVSHCVVLFITNTLWCTQGAHAAAHTPIFTCCTQPANGWLQGLQSRPPWHRLVLMTVAHLLRTTPSFLGRPTGWGLLLTAAWAALCCLAYRGLASMLVIVSWSRSFLGGLVQLLALPPVIGLVAEDWLAPGPVPGEDQLRGPRHSSSLCKALFTLARLLKNHSVA